MQFFDLLHDVVISIPAHGHIYDRRATHRVVLRQIEIEGHLPVVEPSVDGGRMRIPPNENEWFESCGIRHATTMIGETRGMWRTIAGRQKTLSVSVTSFPIVVSPGNG